MRSFPKNRGPLLRNSQVASPLVNLKFYRFPKTIEYIEDIRINAVAFNSNSSCCAIIFILSIRQKISYKHHVTHRQKLEMEESMNNEIDLENVENSQSDMITSHIKQFVTLKESVKNSDRKVQYLKKHMSNLVDSNRNIEANLEKLEQNVFDIDTKISAATKIYDVKKQELKNLESARAYTLRKQWDDSLSKIGNYANDFSQWITEYSRNILMKDIEDHQKECKKVAHEFAFLKEEVDDMRKKYNLNCIEVNVDVDDLPNFDTVEKQ
ncbi:protein MLP1-like isoform X3 [Formica exsecta]|uniref:protein MLP1-like isoform X3 n=1 Tax=Formica exsecta TaxID=72781 RepID=UPI0011444889|nr:protein MLP1-like isoform X3 [Formica exsecta]